MRKQLYTVASLFLTTFAGAQTQKGNGLISGGLSVGSSWAANKSANTALHTWQPNVDVTAGRFVADNWLVGASVSAGTVFTRSERPSSIGTIDRPLIQQGNYVSAGFNPFVRRYWQFAPVHVFVGMGLSGSINGQQQRNDDIAGVVPQLNTVEQRTANWEVNPYVEAGANYFLTKRLALQVALSAASLPLNTAGLSTGLVYWTGANREADPQQVRENRKTNRRNWIVEGYLSMSGSSSENKNGTIDNRQTSGTYIISPSLGYFIGKNKILGLRIPVQFGNFRSTGQNTQDNVTHAWSVGLAPYYQHYWSSTRLTPFTRVEVSYQLYKQGSSDRSTQIVSGTVGLGLAYMAGQRFIVETSLASAYLGYTPPLGPDKGSGLWNAYLSAGLRGNFAVRYVLTRPK